MTLALALAVVGLVTGPVLALVAESVPDYGGGGHPFRACASCAAIEPLGRTYRSTGRQSSCHNCGEPTPRGRGAITIAAALAFGATAAVVGWRWPLVPLIVLAAALISLSAADLARYRLPDRLVFPSFVVVGLLIAVASVLDGSTDHLVPGLVGATVYFIFLLIPNLIMPAGIGFGDVKLAAILGLAAGWMRTTAVEAVYAALYAAILGMVLGLVTSVVVGFGRRVVGPGFLPDPDARDDLAEPTSLRRSAAPFGPGLALGAFLFVLLSGSLMTGPNLL